MGLFFVLFFLGQCRLYTTTHCRLCVKGYDPSGPVKKAAKPKVSKEDKPIISDDLDMEALVFSRTVNKLTVDVLKAWLKTRGVAVFNKKKAELIEDVIKQFSS